MSQEDRTLNAAQGFRLVCSVGDVNDIIIKPNTDFVFTRSNVSGGGVAQEDVTKFSRGKHLSFVWIDDASLCIIGKTPTHHVLHYSLSLDFSVLTVPTPPCLFSPYSLLCFSLRRPRKSSKYHGEQRTFDKGACDAYQVWRHHCCPTERSTHLGICGTTHQWR